MFIFSQCSGTLRGPQANTATNYRGRPPTSNQLMLTDSLMIEKRAPYLFTGNPYHPSDSDQAGWTLEEEKRGERTEERDERRGEERYVSGPDFSVIQKLISQTVMTPGM